MSSELPMSSIIECLLDALCLLLSFPLYLTSVCCALNLGLTTDPHHPRHRASVLLSRPPHPSPHTHAEAALGRVCIADCPEHPPGCRLWVLLRALCPMLRRIASSPLFSPALPLSGQQLGEGPDGSGPASRVSPPLSLGASPGALPATGLP